MKLTWNPNTESDLAGYRLYHGVKSGIYVLEQTLPKTQTNTEVTGLTPGDHYFAVTAFDTESNESGFSNEVYHLEPEATVAINVKLDWSPVTTYDDGSALPTGYTCTYDVFRGQQSSMSDRAKINPSSLTDSNFTDINVQSGQAYYYQVRAGASPPSDFSAIVLAATKKPAQPQGLTALVVEV